MFLRSARGDTHSLLEKITEHFDLKKGNPDIKKGAIFKS
jgi:hypothetical protein